MELEHVESQATELTDSKVTTSKGIEVSVCHSLIPSMVDGKMCSALAEVASNASCNVCNALPKQMNDIDAILKRPVNTYVYQFGCSPLHA